MREYVRSGDVAGGRPAAASTESEAVYPSPVTAPADAERLRRLQLVTDAALSHLRLDDLLQALLERTREVLEVDECTILVVDEDTDELRPRAVLGLGGIDPRVRIPLGAGFAGRVAAERRQISLHDTAHADIVNPILRSSGIESLLGGPLIVDARVIGVIHVGAFAHREFSAEERELLRLVADRAALAIEHARLFDAERQARIRLEEVQAVTDIALAHLSLDDLLAELLGRIRDLLRADTCAFLLLDEDTNELVAHAAVGIEEEVERGVRIPIGRGFAGRVAETRKPVVLPDVDHADVMNPILRERGIKSLLGVPLVSGGQVVGVVHVGTLTPRDFTRDDVELLQLVAERVAMAIERARLHAEMSSLEQLRINFVAVASHELRTPATAVYGALATLLGHDNLPERTRAELLRVGYEQGARLCRLLEQLLDLSQLDSRAIVVRPRPLVLHSVLEQVVAECVPVGMPARVDVRQDLAVVADPLVLERVISNLVTNAVRHGSPPIVVTASGGKRHLRIAVEDAGAGVGDEVRGRMFQRFERSDHAGGSGLGLSIAQAYARAHGGDLVHESGARFELIVPQG
jgi:signal transduction histidine kinase